MQQIWKSKKLRQELRRTATTVAYIILFGNIVSEISSKQSHIISSKLVREYKLINNLFELISQQMKHFCIL